MNIRKLFILLTVLALCLAPSALAAGTRDIDNAFLRETSFAWRHSESYDDGDLAISETLTLDGHPYEFGVVGVGEKASQVYFSGWFADMQMTEDLEFRDGLFAFYDCLKACVDFLPDGNDIYEMFSPYDLYYNVLEGSTYTGGNYQWELLDEGAGELVARHSGPYLVSAERLDDGRIWFIIMFS